MPDLQARLDRDVLAHDPAAVVIKIGINDVWHFDHGRGTEERPYEDGLRDLVRRCQERGAAVVLATPTVIGERWDGGGPHDARLDRYAALSLEVATELGAIPCDLRRLFRELLALRNPTQERSGILTGDGVHLNAAGDAVVAFAFAKALARALAP